jgi:hypothetical protein
MLIDRPQVVEGSSVINLTVPSGAADPSTPNIGELFFRTDLNALRTYGGSSWAEAGAVNLTTHINDATVHISANQNTFLDALNLPTLTAAHVNFVTGLTSNAQTQLNLIVSNFNMHTADYTVHLTSTQNTWIDAITVTSTEVNYLSGVTGLVQSQLDSIVGVNNTQNTRLSTLETTTVPAVQTNLNTHIADYTLHLTAAQNTLLDGLAATLSATELNYVDGVTSSIQTQLNTLAGSSFTQKLSTDGSLAMSGNLSVGGNRITNLGTPTVATDAATKDYVDSFVQGLHWVGSCAVATTANITLSGLQTIDGVALAVSDRVLVKNQTTSAQNGIYLAATGAWSRSTDYDVALEINNSAVFVINGTTQNKSTWVQSATVTVLGTSTITFSAFSGPVVNTAGSGISLGVNGLVSLNQGAGLTFDGNNALVVDLYSGGGLMVTTDNVSPVTLTTVAAQLALTNTGVSANTYNNSATAITPFTVDLKGRITGTGAAVTITPAYSSITGLPTTLAGYGITNAVLKTGDTMTGDLLFSGGMVIRNTAPTASNSWFGTPSYGVAQGDGKTHFGYFDGTQYVNYIRGVATTVSGNLVVSGNLSAANATSTVVGNNFVLRDSNGYVYGNYFNSTDDVQSAGVTGVMVKTGDNFHRTGTAGAIASFISGQNFNTTGNAATATVASSANSVLWTNVSGRPTALSAFTNDVGYLTTGGAAGAYLPLIGGTVTGALGVTDGIAPNDPYGRMSVTMATNGNSYGYYGLTRMGQIGWSFGIDTSNRLFFGTGPGGTAVNVTNRIFTVDNSGNTATSGSLTAATSLSTGAGTFVVSAAGIVTTLNGVSSPNGVIRLTPNLHLNPGAGQAVILSWDNGNGGSAANLAMRVGNGAGGDVFTVKYSGDTTINGTVSAANFSGPGTSLTGTAGSLNIGGTAAFATNWWSTSHNGTYYLVNNWDGTYWNLSSNHPNGVRVAYADSAGSAGSASIATNSTQLGGVAASGYALLSGATFYGDITTYRPASPTTGVIYLGSNAGTRYLYYDGSQYILNGANLTVGGTVIANLSGNVTGNLTGTASTATLASKSSTLSQNGGNGAAMTFNWAGQGGQPSWLWGSNDGVNNYIWNPSNFSVSYAATAGTASSASTATLASNTNSISNAVGGSYTWTGQQSFVSVNSTAFAGASGTLMPQSSGGATAAATISFHRVGVFGLNMGLDNDNVFRLGGWSAAANLLQMDMSGNLTMSGNINAGGTITAQGDVVAYSDRRLKTDVQTIQDPLQKVQELNGITYKRIDSGEVSTGLIAQDVQAVLPEAVTEDINGILAVKYGNLAGLFVEAIKALNKEVAELRAEIKALKDAQ